MSRFISLEIVLLIVALIFGTLWIRNPQGNYEPYLAVLGLSLTTIEVFRRKPKRNSETVTAAADRETSGKNGEPAKFSPITVKEIVQAINSAPPFQKNEVSQSYIGIKVDWIGYLKEAEAHGDSARVNLSVDRNAIVGHSIWFNVKVSTIPEIRTLRRKSTVRVIGEISDASGAGLSVQLKPLTVEVVERNEA